MKALLEVTLRDGRTIRAVGVHASETYAHMYEGRPKPRTNDRYLAGVPERMRSVFNGNFPVYVVPPERRAEPSHPPGELLPRFEFAGEFYDAGKSRCLVIVWYQDDPSFVPTEAVRGQIEALEWSRVSDEFEP